MYQEYSKRGKEDEKVRRVGESANMLGHIKEKNNIIVAY